MPYLAHFTIPLKPITWNALVGRNRWTYKKIKDLWQANTRYAILEAKMAPVNGFKVEIGIHAHWKQKRRHDIDDLYGKGILDQLVYSGILEDDSLEYVTKVTYTGKTGCKKDEMVVTLTQSPDVV